MIKSCDYMLLLDFYESLLSARQADILDLHWNEDYSLAEIAENFDISRQAVHDAIKNGCSQMERFEEQLGLVRQFRAREERLLQIRELAGQLERILGADCASGTQNLLKQIMSITGELMERKLTERELTEHDLIKQELREHELMEQKLHGEEG